MVARKSRSRRTSATVLLLVLSLCPFVSRAECRIVNPGLHIPAGAILSSGSIRFSKDAKAFHYALSLKCRSASRYRLGLLSAAPAQPPGILLLRNTRGDQIVARVHLKRIDRTDVDVYFGALPGGQFEGSIAAEQPQEVVLEIRPVEVIPLGANATGGDYQGTATIRLEY